MKPQLKFLSINSQDVYENGRDTGRTRAVLRVCTPKGYTREIELTARDLLRIIGEAQSLLWLRGATAEDLR